MRRNSLTLARLVFGKTLSDEFHVDDARAQDAALRCVLSLTGVFSDLLTVCASQPHACTNLLHDALNVSFPAAEMPALLQQ